MNKPDIYCFYPNIEIVKGYYRSVVFDSFKNSYIFLPKKLANFFAERKSFSTNDIADICDGTENATSLIEFLKNKDLVTNRYNLELFAKEKREFDYPGIISNAIVEINADFQQNYIELFKQISDLGCHSIEIRFCDFSNELLSFILEKVNNSNISSCNVFVPQVFEINAINHLFESNQKLLNLVMLSGKGISLIPQLNYEKLQSKVFILDNCMDSLTSIRKCEI